MSSPKPLSDPTVARSATAYRITVAGHLDDHWADWFGGHALTRNDDASTTITFQAVDQAHLHGALDRVRDIGVDLLAVCSEGRSQPPALGRTLRTERLTLRPATENDAEPTWAYRRLEAVNEWLTGAPAAFDDYRRVFCEPSRLAATVIVEVRDDARPHLIGDFMLRVQDAWSQAEVTDRAANSQAELGWVLDPSHTGCGYATEAVRELLRYCFAELALHRLVANCFLANDASWHLMERVGMRRETHAIAESLHRSGRWLDTVGYAVLADEWRLRHSPAHDPSKEPT